MNKKIKIVADNKIPFLKGVFEDTAEIEYLNPSDITHETVKYADALIIRTRTNCNAALLDNTNVKFIATATIGFDHIDTEYCNQQNIKWINAPGCNSNSVKQYIASALLIVACKKNINLSEKTIGIVGVGNVGSKVASVAQNFGMKVLLNDPPRERSEGKNNFVGIEKIISESDFISFHVPLIKDGIDKTYHMADESFFKSLKKNVILFNTSRGPVVNNSALKDAITEGRMNAALLDVWENEPNIDIELLNKVDIATPHIAGYSADGKANGTAVSVRGVSEYFNLNIDKCWYPKEIPSPKNLKEITIDCKDKTQQQIFSEAVLYTYDILSDDKTLRGSVQTFEKQRGNYPVRREFNYYTLELKNCNQEIEKKLSDLGFKIKT